MKTSKENVTPNEEVSRLDSFLLGSWGKCPAYKCTVDCGGVSRVCPLASQVYALLKSEKSITDNTNLSQSIPFGCDDHNKGTCPDAEWVIQDAFERACEKENK